MKPIFGQLLLLFIFPLLLSCSSRREETPVIPPVTSPLSSDYIGFGVINASFTHITLDPSEDSPSVGILRRGSLVRILRRQTIRTAQGFVSWVLVEGSQNGWLREDIMSVFNSESQARTASESMSR